MVDPGKLPVAIEEKAVRGIKASLGQGAFLGGEGHLDGKRHKIGHLPRGGLIR